jgi:hypothetical protein
MVKVGCRPYAIPTSPLRARSIQPRLESSSNIVYAAGISVSFMIRHCNFGIERGVGAGPELFLVCFTFKYLSLLF